MITRMRQRMPSLGKLVSTHLEAFQYAVCASAGFVKISSKFRQPGFVKVSSRFRQPTPGFRQNFVKIEYKFGSLQPRFQKKFFVRSPADAPAAAGCRRRTGPKFGRAVQIWHTRSTIRRNPQIPLRTDSVPNLDTSQWTPKFRYVNLRAISRRESVEIAISKKRAPHIQLGQFTMAALEC